MCVLHSSSLHSLSSPCTIPVLLFLMTNLLLLSLIHHKLPLPVPGKVDGTVYHLVLGRYGIDILHHLCVLYSLFFNVVFGYSFALVFACLCYYLCDLVCKLLRMSIVLVFLVGCVVYCQVVCLFGLFWVRVVRKDIFLG